MSKNKKKKNSNYKTAHKTPVKNAAVTSTSSKNPLTIILIVALVIATLVGGFFIVKDMINPSGNTAPTVPLEQNAAGNDTEDMAKYLNEKYGMEFQYEFTSAGASVFSSADLPGLIQVFRREVVQEFDPSIDHLFTDVYADNGYMIVNMDKAVTYYKEKISVDLGNHRLMTYIDIIANPSKVTASTPYTQYLDVIATLSIPELIIVTDKTLTDDEKNTLESEMSAIGKPLAVRVFTLEADKQSMVGPGDIMQLGAAHQNVQYHKILNADHLLDE